jgi:hypothetical protein
MPERLRLWLYDAATLAMCIACVAVWAALLAAVVA